MFHLSILVDRYGIYVTNDHGYVPLVGNTSRSFPHSWLITGFVTRLTRRVPLVEQELLILPEHLSSPPVFSGVRVTRSLVFSVCFVDRCLSFCTFSLGHCVVYSSSIYGFWFPLWYLQTLLSSDSVLGLLGSVFNSMETKCPHCASPLQFTLHQYASHLSDVWKVNTLLSKVIYKLDNMN